MKLRELSSALNKVENTAHPHKYFFISTNDSLTKLVPRVPDNYFTRHGFEDNTTKRVCLSNSINGCLRAMSRNIEGETFQVYSVESASIYTPTTDEVPDCDITGEVCSLETVRLRPLFKIKVLEAEYHPIDFPFDNGNRHAALYDWKWEKCEP